MQVRAAASLARSPEEIVAELSAGIDPPIRSDLAVLLFTDLDRAAASAVAMPLVEQLGIRCLIGMGAQAVICNGVEYEHNDATVLWTAQLPGTTIQSFHLSQEDLVRLDESEDETLADLIGVPAEKQPSFLLLGDPFTVDVVRLLQLLAVEYPERPAIGGLASQGADPGDNVLIFDGHALQGGACGVALSGGVRMDTIVSQGCRPIGAHCVITAAEDNVIHLLSGRPPLQVVSDLLDHCSLQDRQLVQQRGLFLGRVINEYQQTFSRGDFLIRNPIAFDKDTGAMAVNDLIRTGQTVQFHVRDAGSATRDLRELLQAAHIDDALGGLLFTCTGRGTSLFARPHHDASAITRRRAALPLAGCFSAGEIGPIGRQNFIHQHTACAGFLAPVADE